MGCSSSMELPSNAPPRVVQKPRGGGGVNNGGAAPTPLAAQAGRPGDPSTSRQTPANSAHAGWPKVVRIPETQIVVYIHNHQLSRPPQKPMLCWTYISEGLSEVNQPEVVFTLLRRQNEHENDYPEGPVEWVRVVYMLAKNGLNLETGQMCDLVFDGGSIEIRVNQFAFSQPHNKWATFQRFGALLHGIPIASSAFGLPDDAYPRVSHHVIALTREEAAVARQFGPTRVIGHIGLSVRWFPHPPWIDRDRADCVTMADQAGTIRAGLPIARIYGFNVMLVENEIVFTIPEGEAKRDNFRKYVQNTPLHAAVAFDSFMTKDADSGLCWKKGQNKAMGYAANTGPTKHLNLGFITFGGMQAKDTCTMVEDGYAILLRDSTWINIREAIQGSRDLIVNLERGMRFRLEWRKTAYHNPVDGASWHAAWKTYSPGNGVTGAPSNAHVQVSQIILLVQPPNGHMDVKEFADYVNSVSKVLEDAIPITPVMIQGSTQVGRQAIIEIEIPKCEGWLKLVMNPSTEGIPLQQILPEIARVPQPRTLSKVKFQLVMNLWGYQGDSEHFS